MRPFGAAGKIVDGSFANDMERVKRLNIFTERRFSRFLLSDDRLGEFENLINDKSATESDVQNFFEKNPAFLAGFEYSNIMPHLALVPEGDRKMIPDFFLEPIDADYMNIIELKKPFAKITTRKSNGSRVRLTQNVREGIAQLLEYRRFFEVRENRRLFVERYGVRAYRPMMTLIIGRDSEFRGKDEVVNLSEELPHDVELCTYDVLLRRAIMYREMAGQ